MKDFVFGLFGAKLKKNYKIDFRHQVRIQQLQLLIHKKIRDLNTLQKNFSDLGYNHFMEGGEVPETDNPHHASAVSHLRAASFDDDQLKELSPRLRARQKNP